MTNKHNEYAPVKLGDKWIDPAGADYYDKMGYEYFFGIMEMWYRLRPDPVMYRLIVESNGKLAFIEAQLIKEEPISILLEDSIQNAFQAYIMSRVILGEVAQNRSDCECGDNK